MLKIKSLTKILLVVFVFAMMFAGMAFVMPQKTATVYAAGSARHVGMQRTVNGSLVNFYPVFDAQNPIPDGVKFYKKTNYDEQTNKSTYTEITIPNITSFDYNMGYFINNLSRSPVSIDSILYYKSTSDTPLKCVTNIETTWSNVFDSTSSGIANVSDSFSSTYLSNFVETVYTDTDCSNWDHSNSTNAPTVNGVPISTIAYYIGASSSYFWSSQVASDAIAYAYYSTSWKTQSKALSSSVLLISDFGNTTTYTVTYNLNNATSGTAPKTRSFIETETVTVLKGTDIVRTGFTFAGWNTQADGKGTTYAVGETFPMGKEDIILYAMWEDASYTITYNGNESDGGSVPIDSTSYAGSASVTVLGNTGALTKSGFTFAGWNTQADGKGTTYKSGESLSITSNITLYAVWEDENAPATYKIELKQRNQILYKNNVGYNFLSDLATNGIKKGDKIELIFNNSDFYYDGQIKVDGNCVASINSSSGSTSYVVSKDLNFDTESEKGNGHYYILLTTPAVKYSVTYDKNCDDTVTNLPTESSTFIEGADVTISTTIPTRSGYNFIGWSLTTTGSIITTTTTPMVKDGLKLYAIWEDENAPATYKVVSKLSDTTWYRNNIVVQGSSISIKKGDTIEIVFDDSEYYTDGQIIADGVSVGSISSNKGSTSYITTKDYSFTYSANKTQNTYYITLTLIGYTVKYDITSATSGTEPTNTTVYEDGQAFTFEDYNGISKTGYNILGWSLTSNAQEALTTYTINKDDSSSRVITFYPVWKAIDYSIEYKNIDGLTNSNVKKYTIETETITLDNITRTNYVFDGWYKEDTFTTKVTTIEKGSTGNVTLYAKWCMKITHNDGHTFTYTGTTTSVSSSIQINNVSSLIVNLEANCTEGYYYYFLSKVGYYEQENLFDEIKENKLLLDKSKTYYIFIEQIEDDDYFYIGENLYTITYSDNDVNNYTGTIPTNSNNYVNGMNITVSSNTLSKTGYNFTGWNTQADGKGTTYKANDTITVDSENITLYAMFEVITHTCHNIKFYPLTSEYTGSSLEEGNYYLFENILLSSVIAISENKTVNICLNGKVLNLNSYYIKNEGTLNIFDCGNATHKFDSTWTWNEQSTDNSIQGGVLTGGRGYSGKINTTLSYLGGAIFNKGILTIDGGNIVGNKATLGGAIFTEKNSSLTIKNCTISHNTATSNGGGIYVYNDTAGEVENCFAKGTIITLDNGTTKKIENIVEGDIVKTFDHETGKVSSEEVYLLYSGESKSNSFTLNFTNNKSLDIVGCHDLFEKDALKYVKISYSTANDYIGKYFYNAIDKTWEKLLSVTYNLEQCDYYSIYTAHHLNCIANDMLTVCDDVDYFLNIFEFDNNLKINQDKMQADIEKYGLLSYSEASQYVTEEYYENFNVKYHNIAMAKGFITHEEMLQMCIDTKEYLEERNKQIVPKNTLLAPVKAMLGGVSTTSITIGTNAVIVGNTCNSKANNICLAENCLIVIDNGATGFSAGVILENGTGTFVANAVSSSDLQKFTSDDQTYYIKYREVSSSPSTYNYNIEEKYSVTYSLNNGSGTLPTNENKYFKDDEFVIALQGDIARTGYTFGGFSDGTKTYSAGATYTVGIADITLSVVWTAINYDITYNLNDGTNSTNNPATYTIENNVIFNEPTKSGYTFIGWYSDSNFTEGNEVTEIELGSTGKVEIYAKWTIINYSISYKNVEGATNLNTATSYTILTSTITLSNPKKVGYKFLGWYLDSNFTKGNEIFEITLGSTGDKDLYANWEEKIVPTVTAPTAKTLIYNGSNVDLINAGSTTGGILQYSLGTSTASNTYNEAIPQAKTVGTYYVWYKIDESDNYKALEESYITVTISKKEITEPTVNGIYTYNGLAQTVTLNNVDSNISTTSSLTQTNAGEYNIEYTLNDSSNYKWAEGSDGIVSWSIAKKDITFTVVDIASGTYTYDGTSKTTTATYTDLVGTDELKYTLSYSDNINAGTCTVSIASASITKGNQANYNLIISDTGSIVIDRASAVITVDQTAIEKTYGEEVTIPVATTTFGEVSCDKTTNDLVNAGNYTITYTVVGTDNYKGDIKTVSVKINKLAVFEPTVDGTYKYTGNVKFVTLIGKEEYMFVTGTLQATEVGVYTIYVSLDDNHKWVEGSDGIVYWEINTPSISPKNDNPNQEDTKQSVIIESGEGFGGNVSVEVDVTVETEIEQKNLSVDFYHIEKEDIKLSTNERVGVVFDVKLIRTIGGVSQEIQPSDIKEGTVIKVKMLIPESVNTSKVTKILCVYSSQDIEVLEFDASKVIDGYYEVEVDRLAKFAFVYKKDFPIWAIILIVLAILLICFIGMFFVWKYEFDKAKKEDKLEDRKLKFLDFIYRPIYVLIK